jgi:hypothetical protein
MGIEIDWLEREERYRQRVTRLVMAGIAVAVGLGIGARVIYMKRVRAGETAAQKAREDAQVAAVKRQRDLFSAESLATADRYKGFIDKYGASPLANTPLLQVPLPRGTSVHDFVRRIWPEYAHAADPLALESVREQWFKRYYVDLMNEGPLRPSAVLLPSMQQDSTKLHLQRATLTDIANAQVQVGMRAALPPPETAPTDAAATAPPPASANGNPTSTDGNPASTPPVPPPSTPPPDTTPPATTPPAPASPADTTPPAAKPDTTTPKPPPSAPAPKPEPVETITPDAVKPDSVPHP